MAQSGRRSASPFSAQELCDSMSARSPMSRERIERNKRIRVIAILILGALGILIVLVKSLFGLK